MDAFSFPQLAGAVAPALFFLFLPFLAFRLRGKSVSETARYLYADPAYWKNAKLSRQMLLHAAALFVILAVLATALALAFSLAGLSDLGLIESLLLRTPLPILVVAVTLSPIAEELFFRGFLQHALGLPLSAAIFALLHGIYGSYVEVLGAFLIAVVLGLYVRREKNLYPPMMAHAAYNLISVLLAFH